MTKFLSTLKGKLALLITATAAFALIGVATAQYTGFNSNGTVAAGAGVTGVLGLPQTITGTVAQTAVVSGTACTAGTISPTAGNVYKVVTTSTTSACVLTFQYAAPNGYLCYWFDQTTPADTVKPAAFTTTACSAVSGTTGGADSIYVVVTAF